MEDRDETSLEGEEKETRALSFSVWVGVAVAVM